MARILGVGNATLDIVNLLESYPEEDQEVRALSQQLHRGGNATNTLVVLSQLGHDCAWAGTLAEERDAELIRADLLAHRIDLSAVHTLAQGKVPTSYISLSRSTGSRTIVHYRDLPEYPASDFTRIDLSAVEWVHFEGRNIEQLRQMLEHLQARRPALRCSLEVEKAREGIETLFPLVDLLMFSKDYLLQRGEDDPRRFLTALQQQSLNADATCTWGNQGAYALSRHGELLHQPATSLVSVVDTLGAGDVFNAGLIDQRVRGQPLDQALRAAVRLAGKKCGQYGLSNLVDPPSPE